MIIMIKVISFQRLGDVYDIYKSTYVTYYINRLKDTNDTIISIDAEKALGKFNITS